MNFGESQHPEVTEQETDSLPVHISGISFIFGKNHFTKTFLIVDSGPDRVRDDSKLK